MRTAASAILASAGVALALAALAPSIARAQGDAARYQAAIAHALEEFEGGHYEEARAFFRQAHREIPNPRTLRGIGMASYELRDYPEAYRALTLALNFGPSDRDLTPEHRAAATALLERTRGLLALVVDLPPFAQEMRLDGVVYQAEPDGSVIVPLGSHRLAILMQDGRHGVQPLEVAGGETIPWTTPLVGGSGRPATGTGAGTGTGTGTGAGTGTGTGTQPVIRPVDPPPPPPDEPPPPPPRDIENERPPDHRADRQPRAARRDPGPSGPSEPSDLPRFRLNVLGLYGVGSYESLGGYYGATGGGGAVGALVQVAEIFAIGAQVAGTYASLFESQADSDTAYWAQTDVLAWGELRFGPLAIGVGAGLALGIREVSVIDGGFRFIETGVSAAFGLTGDVRVYFVDDLLFVAAEGRFAFGDYGALAGFLAFGVEPVR